MSVNRKVTVPLCRSCTLSALHGKPCARGVTALGPGPCLELGAGDHHALQHANEAVAAPPAVAAAGAVVGHGYLDAAASVANDHVRLGRPRVLDRIREALLNEAVGRQVDAGRQLDGVALDPQVDRQTGLAGLRDEAVQMLKARLRGESRPLLRPAQDAYETAHLR